MPLGFDVWPLNQSNKAITELTVTAFLLLKHPVPLGIGYVPFGGRVINTRRMLFVHVKYANCYVS